MAELALTSIAKSALQLFTSLAKDEFILLWKSQKELQRLENSIEIISCLLQDANRLQSKEHSVQKCLSHLRKVMYDAEDFFDALAAKALHEKTMTSNGFKKEVQLFFSKSTNQLYMIFKIAHQVKSLRESLDGVKGDMEWCGFIRPPLPIVNQQVIRYNRERTHSFVHEEDVIGRDQDRDRIINMILPHDKGEASFDDRSFSVVAIIGFGGLGKTTLAQLVYNNDRVQQGFEVCLWACINDLSNLEQVLIEIIASREGKQSDLGLQKLQEKLREIIGGKKFLVVLDDVWDDNPINWLRLETILRCGNSGSKVLVTTRSTKVAECLDAPKSCSVHLEVLSEESAWSLFVKKAFCKDELSEHPELESLGKKIVGRCGNVPLAIIVIGCLLRYREKNVKIWSEFLDNELGKSLSSSDDDTNQKGIKDVLMVSYNDLLPKVKLCFAYCSLFPKDYVFYKDELVRLWLAQGFITPFDDNGQSLEEQGEAYFFHLVDRCFFEGIKGYGHVNILYWNEVKMHDLLHDVAIDVSKAEIILLDRDSINKRKRDSLRHVSIDSEVEGSLDCCNWVSNPNTVRTLLFHHTYTPKKHSQCSPDTLLTSFRMLRTLSMTRQGIINISSSIGELIHLRYLDLSSNYKLKHLPNSICKLHHLMILVLQNCHLLEKLPRKIEKLVSLRQLYITGCDRLDSLPPGLTALTSLVNLDRLIVHRQSGGLRYLNGLDNLRGVLRIELPKEGWPDAIEDAKRSNMSKKHKLDKMVIDWKERRFNTTEKMVKAEAKAVLEALEPAQRLAHLSIEKYDGEKLPGWFCRLKNVKGIYLDGCENVEYVDDEMKGNLHFPCLQSLTIAKMKNLKGWRRKEIAEEIQQSCLTKVPCDIAESRLELKGQMPLFEALEYLTLDTVDVKLVAELLLSANSNCFPRSSFAPFNSNSKLKELNLRSIEGLICLPEGWIRHLTALERLHTIQCRDLQWVSRRGLSHLTALKHLILECRVDDEEEKEKEVYLEMPWKALRGLKELQLAVGDKHLHQGLKYLSLLKYLEIGKWKGIQLGDAETGGVQLPSKALQNLHTLDIGFDDDDDETIICHLPRAGIQHLHSLRSLSFEGCKELYLGWKILLVNMKLKDLSLKHVGRVIDVEDLAVAQPTDLQSLTINHPREARWVHDIPWKFLASLTWLCLTEVEELPDGIQYLTSLRSLDISKCEKVRSVPTWFHHLTSLKQLMLQNCSEELNRRCEREKGEDWPLIRHIPAIYIITPNGEIKYEAPTNDGGPS